MAVSSSSSPYYSGRRHAILLLLHLGLTAAFQQIPISRLSPIYSVSLHCPTTPSRLLAVPALGDETDLKINEEFKVGALDSWDDQFEELLSFKKDYGHCNFPQNASADLKKLYPTLATFCYNNRIEYRNTLRQRDVAVKMDLSSFDRAVRMRRLEDTGFEFNRKRALWYDRYHELVEFRRANGHVRVNRSNLSLYQWVSVQRSSRRGAKSRSTLSNLKIELLDRIGFEWQSELYSDMWTAKYNELVDFRNQHGHLNVGSHGSLYSWIKFQRKRRAGKKLCTALSLEQIRLLDEIEFAWKAERDDERWNDKYNDLAKFRQTYGHCRPAANLEVLYHWSETQRSKRKKALLSKEQINLLDEIDFSWEKKRPHWNKMHDELIEFYNEYGHLQVNHKKYPSLHDWMDIQRKRYHGAAKRDANQAAKLSIPEIQIEKLENVNFCWSLDWRERVWKETYTEVVEFYKQNGHIQVTENENPSLYNWIRAQEKRYKEMEGHKPLSKEELELLEQIDFSFFENQPRTTWDEMYAEVDRSRKENDGYFPSHKDDPSLSCWMRQQRMRLRCACGYAPLSDQQRALLESIDFPKLPNGREGRAWYAKYDKLVEYKNQHGNFLVERKEDVSLYGWVETQRARYKGVHRHQRALIRSEIYLLERIGFPWANDRYEADWQMRYDELVQFWKKHGHLRVPRRSNRCLFDWLSNQGQRYRGRGYSEMSTQQIKKMEEIGMRRSTKD